MSRENKELNMAEVNNPTDQNESDVPENVIKKYEELYSLAKEVFREEVARAYGIEQKAAVYISVFTVLLGLFGFFSKQILGAAVPPETVVDYSILTFCGVALFYIIRTWFVLIGILRVIYLQEIPVDVDYYAGNTLVTIYYSMAKAIRDNLLVNRRRTDIKALKLGHAYRMMRIVAVPPPFTLPYLAFS